MKTVEFLDKKNCLAYFRNEVPNPVSETGINRKCFRNYLEALIPELMSSLSSLLMLIGINLFLFAFIIQYLFVPSYMWAVLHTIRQARRQSGNQAKKQRSKQGLGKSRPESAEAVAT